MGVALATGPDGLFHDVDQRPPDEPFRLKLVEKEMRRVAGHRQNVGAPFFEGLEPFEQIRFRIGTLPQQVGGPVGNRRVGIDDHPRVFLVAVGRGLHGQQPLEFRGSGGTHAAKYTQCQAIMFHVP